MALPSRVWKIYPRQKLVPPLQPLFLLLLPPPEIEKRGENKLREGRQAGERSGHTRKKIFPENRSNFPLIFYAIHFYNSENREAYHHGRITLPDPNGRRRRRPFPLSASSARRRKWRKEKPLAGVFFTPPSGFPLRLPPPFFPLRQGFKQ